MLIQFCLNHDPCHGGGDNLLFVIFVLFFGFSFYLLNNLSIFPKLYTNVIQLKNYDILNI